MGFNDKFDDQENQHSGEAQGSDQALARTHSLGDAGIDAGTVDVTPATASVEIIREEPRVVMESPVEQPLTRRTNYSRRDSLRGESFDQPEPAAMLTADRLIDTTSKNRVAPTSGLRRFLYFV